MTLHPPHGQEVGARTTNRTSSPTKPEDYHSDCVYMKIYILKCHIHVITVCFYVGVSRWFWWRAPSAMKTVKSLHLPPLQLTNNSNASRQHLVRSEPDRLQIESSFPGHHLAKSTEIHTQSVTPLSCDQPHCVSEQLISQHNTLSSRFSQTADKIFL